MSSITLGHPLNDEVHSTTTVQQSGRVVTTYLILAAL